MTVGEPTPLVITAQVPVPLDSTDEAILEQVNAILKKRRPKLEEIRQVVCDFYLCTRVNIESGQRQKEFTYPRHVFCYFAHRYTHASLNLIARYIGHRDHTTVLHAVRGIQNLMLTKPLVADDLDLIRLRISEKVLARGAGKAW